MNETVTYNCFDINYVVPFAIFVMDHDTTRESIQPYKACF